MEVLHATNFEVYSTEIGKSQKVLKQGCQVTLAVWKMFPCNRVRSDFEGLGWGRRHSNASNTSSDSSVLSLCPSDSLPPHGLQHTRPPCPLPTPRVYSDSCPPSQWWHPTILSSVIPFSCCLQSFPASGSFPRSQFFPSGGQSIWASASASDLPMDIQNWFPLGWTGWISLQSKGLSRVFSNTTVVTGWL